MSYKTKEECKLELKLQELTGYKEKDPAFLFYSADFIGKMAKFTMEERGQIITLLALQHQNGHLTQKIIDNMVPNLSEWGLFSRISTCISLIRAFKNFS